jgi:hypothetical protein
LFREFYEESHEGELQELADFIPEPLVYNNGRPGDLEKITI